MASISSSFGSSQIVMARSGVEIEECVEEQVVLAVRINKVNKKQ